MLDGIWSDVATDGVVAEENHEEAINLLEGLRSELDVCVDKAQSLRRRVAEHPEVATEYFETLLAEKPPHGLAENLLTNEARHYWEETLRKYGRRRASAHRHGARAAGGLSASGTGSGRPTAREPAPG
jgi:hypothetical protein